MVGSRTWAIPTVCRASDAAIIARDSGGRTEQCFGREGANMHIDMEVRFETRLEIK
jgi:hypothetical protein